MRYLQTVSVFLNLDRWSIVCLMRIFPGISPFFLSSMVSTSRVGMPACVNPLAPLIQSSGNSARLICRSSCFHPVTRPLIPGAKMVGREKLSRSSLESCYHSVSDPSIWNYLADHLLERNHVSCDRPWLFWCVMGC